MGERGVSVLGARPTPGDRAAVEVFRFDGSHPRVLLGPHLHDDLELMFFAGGGGLDRLGEHDFPVSDGDLVLVTPGIVHDASGLGPAWGWAVEFSVDAVALAQSPAAAPPPTEAVPQLWWSNPLLTPFVAAGQRPGFARFRVPESDRAAWSSLRHECRPLCAEQRQFPLNPTAMLLRNQTAVLGIRDEVGSLRAGLRADAVVVSPELELEGVLRDGVWIRPLGG